MKITHDVYNSRKQGGTIIRSMAVKIVILLRKRCSQILHVRDIRLRPATMKMLACNYATQDLRTSKVFQLWKPEGASIGPNTSSIKNYPNTQSFCRSWRKSPTPWWSTTVSQQCRPNTFRTHRSAHTVSHYSKDPTIQGGGAKRRPPVSLYPLYSG